MISGSAPVVQQEFDAERRELEQLAKNTSLSALKTLRLENGHFVAGKKGRFKYWGLRILGAVSTHYNGKCRALREENRAQQQAAKERIMRMTAHAQAPSESVPAKKRLADRNSITVRQAVRYVAQNPSERFTANRSTWVLPPTLNSDNPWRVNPKDTMSATALPVPAREVLEDYLKLEYRVEPQAHIVQEKIHKEVEAVAQQQKKLDGQSDALDSKTDKLKRGEKDFQLFKELAGKSVKAQEQSTSASKAAQGTTELQSTPVVVNSDFESIPESNGAGEAHTIGGRRSMEDATLFTTISVNTQNGPVELILSGMFDGHGSPLAAEFARDNIASHVKNRLEEGNPETLTDVQIWNALKLAFVDTSNSFRAPKEVSSLTGTTANLVIQNPQTGDIWVANAGDSRALLVSPEGETIQLSEDAKPKDEKYKAAVSHRGGEVFGSRVNALIGSARGIGDHATYGASTARPKITKYSRPESGWQGYTLVQGCDGLFDVAASNTIGKFVHESRETGASAAYIANQLVGTAYYAHSADNISAMVMPLS